MCFETNSIRCLAHAYFYNTQRSRLKLYLNQTYRVRCTRRVYYDKLIIFIIP